MNEILEILDDFRRIPYENISKILRLEQKPEQRPRMPETILREHLSTGSGGTCFSLNYAVIKSLRAEGVNAYPAAVRTGRENFPHYSVLFEYKDNTYLIDPGYLIYQPLLLDPEHPSYGSNGVLDYELISYNNGFRLSSYSAGRKKTRYDIQTNPVDDDIFILSWIRSFDYISAVVASRILDDKILYINGDYVRFTSPGTVQKTTDRRKADTALSKHFGFTPDQILKARRLAAESRARLNPNAC